MIGCHPYRDECFLWDRFPGYRCARPGANGFNASGVETCATPKPARRICICDTAKLSGLRGLLGSAERVTAVAFFSPHVKLSLTLGTLLVPRFAWLFGAGRSLS